MKGYTIWSNYIDSDYYAELMEEAEANDFNGEAYLYDLLESIIDLNDCKAEVLAIGDLGLWSGRVTGYKELNNYEDIFYSDDAYYQEFTVDRYGNLRGRATHHDGTNYYLFREWKDGLSWEQKDNFLDKIYRGKATKKDISRYTKAIGKEIIF